MNRHPSTPRSAPDEAICCLPKPVLADRRLLSNGSAAELAGLFKVLASDTRLRLLHALVRDGELCVSELCRQVRMKPQAVSNQLQRLADWSIVDSRRDGLQVFYRITDPCVPELLDRGLCLLEDAKERRR
ncbi:MAG: ArsR/SmtB family transcription factor [Planctomycetota bacterium]